MRITLESDYALRILTAMAGYTEVTDAKKIADDTSVTPRFALKILHKLVQGDLVRSYKGVNGGYTLKTTPDKITLKSVIELIDGPICITRCIDGECSLNSDKASCTYHHIFDTISLDLARRLDGITISDVINKTYTLK
jgi:Rrf2 family protein